LQQYLFTHYLQLGVDMMIRIFDDNKHICECCDNDSIILIDFTEDTKPHDLGSRVYLCNEHKEKLIDLLLPF
jgi:hypothetical protein